MLILASASPRRRELLKNCGIKFKVQPSTYTEDLLAETPEKTALLHAIMKARQVAQTAKASKNPQDPTLILGVDTIGEHKGEILGKPRDLQHASSMIKLLNGSTHNVISGICLINKNTNQEFSATVSTQVSFEKMTKTEIENYLKTGEWQDKAASYAIQGYGAFFVKEIKGDYFNVVGLPLNALYQLYKRAGLQIL